jgi:addiction module RelE/StbE family toxin
MANYKVIFQQSAKKDLDDVYLYIAEQALLPKTALKLTENIENEINYYLSYMPFYPLADDKRLARKGVRKMVVKKYLVFFVVDENENTVNVIHIIHGAREWNRLFTKK